MAVACRDIGTSHKGFRKVCLSLPNGFFHAVATRTVSRYGGRQGASRAVCVRRSNRLRRKLHTLDASTFIYI